MKPETWNLELGTWNLELGTWNLELPRLQIPVLLRGVEARTGLRGREHVVTHDQGLGKLGVKLLHQLAHRLHLGSRAGVPRETLVVETAFVAHTDAVAVVVLTVGAHHR